MLDIDIHGPSIPKLLNLEGGKLQSREDKIETVKKEQNKVRVKHTTDSPILLKLVPEKPMDIFENGLRSGSFKRMKIPHKVKEDGTLLINIDPDWKDFTEHDESTKRGK